MEKVYKFAFRKTENFSGEEGEISLFSEKKKFKNYCLTNLNQLYEQRGTLHSGLHKRTPLGHFITRVGTIKLFLSLAIFKIMSFCGICM